MDPVTARGAGWSRGAAAPVLALLAIGGLDWVGWSRPWPLPVVGLLDESAHLLTAWLAIAAFPTVGRRLDRRWVLLGAVVIDLDHLPLYLWGALATSAGGRPVTHSLVTVLALLAFAASSRRLRAAAAGLAVGVLLHFLRDVATGPGLPIAWPLDADSTLLPYGSYLGVVVGLAGLAVLRRSGARHGTAPRGTGPHRRAPHLHDDGERPLP